MKSALLVTACLSAFFALTGTALAQDGHATVQVSYPQTDQPAWRYASESVPAYPRRLAQSGTTGCAVFDVDFNEQGDIQHSEQVAVSSGRRLGSESERLMQSWDWQPANPDAPEAAKVQVRVDYCMARGAEDEVIQACAQQAQMTCS